MRDSRKQRHTARDQEVFQNEKRRKIFRIRREYWSCEVRKLVRDVAGNRLRDWKGNYPEMKSGFMGEEDKREGEF